MNSIKDRKKVYGDYENIAELSQELKGAFYERYTGGDDNVIFETIDMLLHKLARIANNPYYIDNWRDICGYANLAIEHIKSNCDYIDSKVVYLNKKDK